MDGEAKRGRGQIASVRLLEGAPSGRGPMIRSVSQAMFQILGEAPFEAAVREAVAWMRKRNLSIPQVALEGQSFEVGGGGVSPAQAVNLTFEGGRVWAASLDDPDKQVVGRTWVTEITVGEREGRVLFGTRLINVTGRGDDPFVPSLPGVSRQIVGRLPSRADEMDLSERAWRVVTPDQVDDLIALLDDGGRTLPVLVISDAISRPPFVLPDVVAGRLAGAAHVVSLHNQAAQELISRWGKQLSVYDGAARLYRPGFWSDKSDPFEHPLWMSWYGGNPNSRADFLVARVLSSVVASSRNDYARFDVVRQAAAANAISKIRNTASDTDLSHLFEEENQKLTDELRAVRAEFKQWMDDFDLNERNVEREIGEIKSELARARAQNDSLRLAIASGLPVKTRDNLESIPDIGVWSRDNLTTNIWIAPKAIKEAEKRGVFEDPKLIGDALIMLDELYVPMRRDPGEDRRATYEAKLAELNCQDQPCFSNPGSIKSFPEYSVVYQGQKFWCEHHIKYGGGADHRRFFRIYYHWHEGEQILLIGHLPTHLDNKLTN
ncbi:MULTISPECIES: hypothetical protein [unclassified Caulobacter]|uniref:hypothetical protein n=1 Tax=unclassified Caulobacter TaxID=2648921 RepID=UPI0011B794B2|nr:MULTISPECIES: hypothetical protein [unclassified Caulobacter]